MLITTGINNATKVASESAGINFKQHMLITKGLYGSNDPGFRLCR